MSIINKYRHYCFKIYFQLKSIIAPDLKYSQYIYESYLFKFINKEKKWLDLGCGQHVLPAWRYEQEKILINKSGLSVGLDFDIHSLVKNHSIPFLIRGDISTLPIKNNTFDVITANMVFEHLSDPYPQIKEIIRILKPGGILLFHTPNIYGYNTICARSIPDVIKTKLTYFFQNRKEEDIFKTFYYFNSKNRIYKVENYFKATVKEVNMIVSSPILIMLPPLVIFELFFIRLLMKRRLRNFRTNIIAIIIKNAV